MFNQKSTKSSNIIKNYNKKQNENNFATCAIWILEKGYDMMTHEGLLPNLT